MELWQIFSIVGFAFLILEMLTPSYFCLNFGIAAFFTAAAAVFVTNLTYIILIFAVLSLLLLVFFRPFLMRKNTSDAPNPDNAYIGKIAKAVENIGADSGTVSIYDERCNSRTMNGELIEAGAEVKIVKLESLIMYVERV